jgi:molybdate transport system regulatory protein
VNENAVKISARNQVKGRIKAIKKGGVVSRVEIEVPPSSRPLRMVAVITNDAVEDLNLQIGDEVTTMIKSTEVMIGKD